MTGRLRDRRDAIAAVLTVEAGDRLRAGVSRLHLFDPQTSLALPG